MQKALGNLDTFKIKKSHEQVCDLENITMTAAKRAALEGRREETEISSQEAVRVIRGGRSMA